MLVSSVHVYFRVCALEDIRTHMSPQHYVLALQCETKIKQSYIVKLATYFVNLAVEYDTRNAITITIIRSTHMIIDIISPRK